MIRLTIAASAALLAPGAANALDFPARDRHPVIDAAHVLTRAETERLRAVVGRAMARTHHQLAVVTVPTLEGRSIADYGYQLGRVWAIGDKANDGTLILLAPHERKVRIEVGYGLEPTLTDALSSRIVRDRIVPLLRQGRTEAALEAGVEGIAAVDVPLAVAPQPHRGRGSPWVVVIALAGFAAFLGTWVMFLWRGIRDQLAEDRAYRSHSYILRTTDRPPIAPTSTGPGIAMREPSPGLVAVGTDDSAPAMIAAAAFASYAASGDARRAADGSPSSWGSSYGSGGSDYGSSDTGSSYDYGGGGGSFGGGGADSSY